jgi:hypothetical protein
MNLNARMVFLSGALAVTLACGCATVYASAIYETHVDVYKAMTARSTPERAVGLRVRESKSARHGVQKPSPVASSDIQSRALTTDARLATP